MLNCAISKTQGPLSPHSWGTRGKHEHAASSEETVDDADGRTCIIFHISTILPTDYLPYTIQLKSIGLGSYSIYRTTIFYIPYYETAMCLMFDTVPYCICTVPYYHVLNMPIPSVLVEINLVHWLPLKMFSYDHSPEI